jgi:hypothetical protein
MIMTQEDKQLLLVDLCARLPYRVKCIVNGLDDCTLMPSDIEEEREIKPYLRPMSNMTEEEKKEYELLANHCIVTSIGFIHLEVASLTDWLNAHHFDFRNLIERGLAIDCTDLNVY